ncbi:MAG: 16S rRNA (guanine(966)-N(2))-methyltransferase RsmD [Acidobacteria bacterium]|nr:16S rRNA (guanine(966)-N(2))-methyltransferase RsmD [Acidobacteriota bacterium]
MRVIAGEFRSRKLASVPGLAVRPTPDRLRESLFSILMPVIEGAVFVDAYAGSGSVGIEALSRGAKRCVFIERSSAALEVLRANLVSLGAQARVNVIRGKAAQVLGAYAADIVFLDPPYTDPDEYGAAMGVVRARMVIAQHAAKQVLEDRYGVYERYRLVKQGDNTLSFYRPLHSAGAEEDVVDE